MIMKQDTLAITTAVAGLLFCTATAQQNSANRMTGSDDRTFVTKAAQGGMAEVELGHLATQRAANEKVKQFGERMVADHTKANDELKAIAAKDGLSVPANIDSQSRAVKKHLSTLHGTAFDRAYMEDMVSDHRQDIAEFQHEADHGNDGDVRAFASKTLPTLQHHLKLAEEALNDMKNSSIPR